MSVFESDEQKAWWQSQLEQLTYALQHSTQTSERLATGVMNHVLLAGTFKLEDSANVFGVKRHDFQATVGSVEIVNGTANAMVLAAGPEQTNIPAQGTGVFLVPARTWRLCNIARRSFSVYGTIADAYSVQAFTTGGVYGAGVLA